MCITHTLQEYEMLFYLGYLKDWVHYSVYNEDKNSNIYRIKYSNTFVQNIQQQENYMNNHYITTKLQKHMKIQHFLESKVEKS